MVSIQAYILLYLLFLLLYFLNFHLLFRFLENLPLFLHYLNYCGIPGEFIINGDSTISSDVALCIFEAFENIINDNYSFVHGVFANLALSGEKIIVKFIFENVVKSLSNEMMKKLSDAGIACEITQEEETSYIYLTIKEDKP